MYLGLAEKVINVIVQLEEDGILFVCLRCRVDKRPRAVELAHLWF